MVIKKTNKRVKLHKSAQYFGKARYIRTSPNISSEELSSLNLEVPFEEALKLYVAIQACLQSLNRYHRGTKIGKSMGMDLWINIDNKSIHVSEAKFEKQKEGE